MYTCLLCRLAFRAPFTSSSEKSLEPWQPKWSQGIWGSIDARFLNICWTIIKWQTSEFTMLWGLEGLSFWPCVSASFVWLQNTNPTFQDSNLKIAQVRRIKRIVQECARDVPRICRYKQLHLVPKLSWNILKPGWWHWLNYFLFTRPKIGSKTSSIWGWFPRYISG